MYPFEDVYGKVDDIASIVLPALLEQMRTDTKAIDERARAWPLLIVDLRARLTRMAEKIVSRFNRCRKPFG